VREGVNCGDVIGHAWREAKYKEGSSNCGAAVGCARRMLGKWRSSHAAMERNEETIYYSRVKIGTNLAIK
jgi:DNA-directed RNA polymerase subunit N (RpoN/RPB10)